MLGPRRGICNLSETYCQIPRDKGEWESGFGIERYGLTMNWKKIENLKKTLSEKKKESKNQI